MSNRLEGFRAYIEFEQLVGNVLIQLGYRVQLGHILKGAPSRTIREIDIVASGDRGVVRPVEVKLTRRKVVALAQLRDASSVAAGLKNYAIGAKPLLVFGAEVDEANREWAEREFDIEIWDRRELLRQAGPEARALEDFFAAQASDSAVTEGPVARAWQVQPPEAIVLIDAPIEPAPDPNGEALINKLRVVPFGNKGAKAFEEICREVIDYIFGEDLRDARSQRRTSDNLNIYDLVYRVKQQHAFWITLTRDFRSRVVLFECKNYGKPIGPAQVFSTERYLSISALRPVCFVISRKPANKNATQAAFGAMRESGKLLVFLSDQDLIEMIRAKDAQLRAGGSEAERAANDPTELLDQRIYDFLSTMPR